MSFLQRGTRGLALAGLSVVALGVLAFAGAPRSHPGTHSASTAEAPRASFAASPAMSAGAQPRPLALDPLLAGADPLIVEPRVPRAAGTPCVVELVRNSGFIRPNFAEPFFFLPPAGCPGPWAKVVLVVELSGPRPPDAPSANIEIRFDGALPGDPSPGSIFVGAPQEHDGVPVWRLERDVTDYAALFTRAQTAYLIASDDNSIYEDGYLPIGARAIKLLFYPASAQTPAPRVADAVYALPAQHWTDGTPRAAATLSLPRNIERAYLDVTAQALGAQRFWYGCVPQAMAAAYPTLRSKFALGDARARRRTLPQGCVGGSFREVEVRIDGQRAGLAPMFPWLPSNLHERHPGLLDGVAPSTQALNFLPFRVDLSPFAALLSDGAPHTIEAVVVASEPAGYAHVSAQLLLHLDRGSVQVTGGVVRNTLADQPARPQVTSTLAAADETVQGELATTARRHYVIEGVVRTSRGRLRHTVVQTQAFANRQILAVTGPDPGTLWFDDPYKHDYLQKIRLSSTVDRVSRSTRDGVAISEDREYFSYPLLLDYRHAGLLVPGEFGDTFLTSIVSARAHQARGLRATHVRPGIAPYRTQVSDAFDASQTWQPVDGQPAGRRTGWQSRRDYLFTDSYGSCYSATLATADGALVSRTRGTKCPGGRNALRWFARGDGAPDGLGWAPAN